MNQNSSTAENLEFIANQIYPDVVVLCNNETVKKKDKTMKKRIYFTIKRLFDIIASFFALIILSPIFLITAIAIKVDSKGPAFYSQMRVGKMENYFVFISLEACVKMRMKKGLNCKNLMNGVAQLLK